jgi:uroporphyrin-III C-methyltransferase/precorrin-2 dehydrogenase/sirohydrochlorin ferrochelatase
VQYLTGHAENGELPRDIDWQSIADPAATTVVYMPVKTLPALVAGAIGRGLDPATPAIAVSRATRADEVSIAAPVADLPARLAAAGLPGPVLVMIGRVFSAVERRSVAAPAALESTQALN